jgi:endonuclease/exonuclease/phosphatase family metal-dependent hydrolase
MNKGHGLMTLNTIRRIAAHVTAGLVISAAAAGSALAQTVKLTQSNATVIRGGTYASTNFSNDPKLATRASGDATYVRRSIMKFDTQNTIPKGASITSATLTLTVAGGNSESRTIAVYRVGSSYDESYATWKNRKSSYSWPSAGSDLKEKYDTSTVTNSVGSHVSFDLKSLVQGAVSGKFDTRYTRIALVDTGSASQSSYKEYYSDDAGDSSVRPVLTVSYTAGTTSVSAPSTSTTSTSTLRVLHWNTHHGGYGTDGDYDPNRLANWIVKMNPDIISLNEIEYYTGWGNENQPARYAALLKSKTGRTWYYKFATATGASHGNGNLILSRFPLADSDAQHLSYDRVATQVRVTVNGRTINFISTHLDDDSSSQRSTQMGQLKTFASSLAQQRIIAGDFNTWPSAGEISKMTSDYYDGWATAVKNGTDIAYSGNTAGNTRNSRIDYIFYSHSATALVLKSVQVYDTRDSSGVMPSDHRPILAVFTVK